MSINRRLFLVASAVGICPIPSFGQGNPSLLRKQGRLRYAIVMRHLAANIEKRIVWSLIWAASADGLRHADRVWLMRTDIALARLDKLKAIEQELVAELARGVDADVLQSRFEDIISSLRELGAVSAAQLSVKQAQDLLGRPGIQSGRLAQLSDNVDKAMTGALTSTTGAGGLIALRTVPAFEGMVVTLGSLGTGPGVTSVSMGAASLGYLGLYAAFGTGVAMGYGIDQIASGLISGGSGGKFDSIGSWLSSTENMRGVAEFITGVDATTLAIAEGDLPATASPALTSNNPTGSEDGEGAGADRSSDEQSGSAGSEDTGGSEGNDSGSDQDDAGAEESESDASDAGTDDSEGDDQSTGSGDGTTLPPDFDTGGSGFGNLLLFATSGLLASEARRQLAALDLAAGGRFGASRTRSTFGANIVLSQLIGGGFLQNAERGLAAHRDRFGIREGAEPGTFIAETSLPNFGLINPSPIDMLFVGRTSRTRGRR